MHFKRELKSYLAALRTKFNAFLTVAFCTEDLFLALNTHLFTCILEPLLIPLIGYLQFQALKERQYLLEQF